MPIYGDFKTGFKTNPEDFLEMTVQAEIKITLRKYNLPTLTNVPNDSRIPDNVKLKSQCAKLISDELNDTTGSMFASSVRFIQNKWLAGKPIRAGEYWVVIRNDPEASPEPVISMIYVDNRSRWRWSDEAGESIWFDMTDTSIQAWTHYMPVEKPYCTAEMLNTAPAGESSTLP